MTNDITIATVSVHIALVTFEIIALVLLYPVIKKRIVKSFIDQYRYDFQQDFRNAAYIIAPQKVQLGDITGAFKNREEADVRKFLSRSQSELDIYTPNLKYFTMEGRGKIFEDAIKRECKIRVLALNPKNAFTSERFSQIELGEPRAFASEMLGSLEIFLRDYAAPGLIELRVFNEPPTTLILRSDNEVLVSFILRQARSREYLHLRMRCDQERLGKPFVTHFDTAFNSAKEVTTSLLSQIRAEVESTY